MSTKSRDSKKPVVNLNLDDLDHVVGGATAPLTTAQLNTVAGFDTSHTDLSAAAMASGAAEAAVAHVVAAGQGTEAGAMHLLVAVAGQNHQDVAQALAGFAGQIITAPGHAGDATVVGSEIGHLVSTNALTGAVAAHGIDAAVTAGSLASTQALSLLTGMAAGGNAAAQTAAGGELAALISSHHITADQAVTTIDGALASHALTGPQAASMLAGLAAGGDASVQTAVGHELATLITSNQLTAAQAMTGIDQAVTANAMTGEAAVSILLSAAADGTTAIQQAAGVELAALIANPRSALTPSAVVADIAGALTSHALTSDQALPLLTNLAANGDAATQTVAIAELATLTAVPVTGGTSAEQLGAAKSAILKDITPITVYDGTDPASTTPTATQVIIAINAIADGSNIPVEIGHGSNAKYRTIDPNTADFESAGFDAAAAVYNNVATPAAVLGGIQAAVADQGLNTGQNLTILLSFAEALDGFARTSNGSAQAAVGSQLAALINNNPIYSNDPATAALAAMVVGGDYMSPAQVVAAIHQAVTSPAPPADGAITLRSGLQSIMSADQAVSVLAGMAAHGNAATQQAAVGEINALIAGNQIGAGQAMADIDKLVGTYALTGHQAVTLVSELAAKGDASFASAAGTEIASLITGNHISAAQAMKDIDAVTTSNLITGVQAASLLGNVAASGNAAAQTAVTSELSSLIDHHLVTADQAVSALLGVAAQASPAVQAVEGAQLAALIANNHLTASQVATDIDHAVSSGAIGGDQAVGVLASLASHGKGDAHSAALNEISSLVAGNALGATQAAADIAGALTAAQAVPVLASCAVLGNASLQGAAYGEINTLIAGHARTATQAMTDIGNEVTSGLLTASQAVTVLLGTAAAGTTAVQGAAGSEIATLIANPANALSAAGLIASLDTQAHTKGVNNPWPADKLVSLLTGIAAAGTPDAHSQAVNEIMSLINGNFATTAMTDIGNAVPGDQAISVLANVATLGNAALQNSVGREIAALYASHAVTAAQAMTDITTAVAAGLPPAAAVAVLIGTAEAGTVGLQGAAGGELAALIANPANALGSDTVIASLGAAVAAKAMTPDQEISVLAGLVANGDAATHTSALSAMMTVINGNTAAHAMQDIGTALGGDQAMAVLASVAAVGTAAVQAAAAGEISALINGNVVTVAQAMTDIDHAVSAKVLTGGQAVSLLAEVANVGSAAAQIAAGGEIGALIAGSHITADQAMTTIDQAVSTKTLSADRAITLLAGAASAGAATAVAGEIAALVGSQRITADQVVADLARAWNGGSAGLQAAVSGQITTLIGEHLVTPVQALADFGNAIGAVNPGQAITLLAEFALSGTAALQDAAVGEIVSLLANKTVTVAQLTGTVGDLVKGQTLTADQGVTILGDAVAQTLAKGDTTLLAYVNGAGLSALALAIGQSADQLLPKILTATGGEFATMIAGNQITPAQIMADINALIVPASAGQPANLNGAQVVSLLGGVAAGANVALGAIVGQELTTLMTATPTTPIVLTAAQAVAVIAAVGNTAGAAALGAAMMPGLKVDLTSTIDHAVTAGSMTGAQAIAVLAGQQPAAASPSEATAIHNEIVALIATKHVAAADAATALASAAAGTTGALKTALNAQIGALISGGQITAQQALTALVGVETAAGGESAAVNEIVALVESKVVTPAQVASAVGGMVAAHTLTAAQGLAVLGDTIAQTLARGDTTVLAYVEGTGLGALATSLGTPAAQLGPQILSAAGSGMAALIAGNQITAAQAMTDINLAIVPTVGHAAMLTAAQAVQLLGGVAASGNVGVSAALGQELTTLMTATPTTPIVLSAAQAVSVVAAATSPAAEAALGAAMMQGFKGDLTTTIDQAVNTRAMTGVQAVAFLAGEAAAAPSAQQATAARNEIVSLITSKRVAAGDVATALASAAAGTTDPLQTAVTGQLGSLITGGQIPAQQALAAIAGIAVSGNEAAAANEIMSLIESKALTPAQVTSTLGGLMAAHTLTAAQGVALLGDAIAQTLQKGDTSVLSYVEVSGLSTLATSLGVSAVALGPQILAAAGSSLAAMIAGNQITAAQATADINLAILATAGHPAVLTAAQAVPFLSGVAASGNVTVNTALGQELNALLNSGTSISPMQAAAVIAAAGNPAAEAALGAAMSQGLKPDLTTVIDQAVKSKVMTGAQAVAFLTGLSAAAPPPQQTAMRNEITSLITTAKAISAADAVSALASAAVGVPASLLTVINAQIAAMVKNYQL